MMTDSPELANLLDVPLQVEATLPGPALSVGSLLALGVGSIIATGHAVGKSIDVYAGKAYIGAAELAAESGSVVARIVTLKS